MEEMEGSRKDRKRKEWEKIGKKPPNQVVTTVAETWVCKKCCKSSHISCGKCKEQK